MSPSRLRRGPSINVFVGKRPNLDLVFPISKSLLAYFSPVLRPSVQSAGGKDIVVLHDADKKAVSWLLRWMLNSGREKTYVDKPTTDDPTQRLLNRLRVVTMLGVQGWLEHSLTAELEATILKGGVTIGQLAWIYTTDASSGVRALGKHLAFTVVNAILDGTMRSCVDGASKNPIFFAEVAAALRTRKSRLYEIQNVNWVPLTPFQIHFIYFFTARDTDIRKMITGHLLKLMDHGYVPDLDSYKQLAWKIDDFETDMSKAIEEKEKWLAEQRKARASVRALRQPNKQASILKKAGTLPQNTANALLKRPDVKSVAIKPPYASSPAYPQAGAGVAPVTTPAVPSIAKSRVGNGNKRNIKYPYENRRYVPTNPMPPPPEKAPESAALTATAAASPSSSTFGTRVESDIVLTISSDGVVTEER